MLGSELRRRISESGVHANCRLLNFHMDTRLCLEQDDIIEVAPLALPVEVVPVDEHGQRYDVNSLPTIMLVGPDGREIHRWTGTTSSEVINSYLADHGYVSRHAVPDRRGTLTEVAERVLKDGSRYTGEALCCNDVVVPEGMGVRYFSDHNDLGRFSSFHLNGVCYRNHHDFMYAGMAEDGKLNGWGMYIGHGEVQFGLYRDDRLRINLTPLVKVFLSRINELTVNYHKSLVKVQKNPDSVFYGCPRMNWSGRFGVTFRPEGDVFIGQGDLGTDRELTGYYLHIDRDGHIIRGYYSKGELQRVCRDDDDEGSFISNTKIWVSHEYLDFDTDMRYAPEEFDLERRYLYGIVDIGNTPDCIIVKANPCRKAPYGNSIEYTDYEDESTRWFAFDREDSILQKLMELYQNNTPWVPMMDDFRVDFVNNIREAGTSHLVMYRHRSCWEHRSRYFLHREGVGPEDVDLFGEDDDETPCTDSHPHAGNFDDDFPF